MDNRLVYYWSRDCEERIVIPETTKNHFGKLGVPGILLGDEDYRNPWVQGGSFKYFARLNYENIYDFDLDPLGLLQKSFSTAKKTGTPLLDIFEKMIQEPVWGFDGYITHSGIKYFRSLEVFRDYGVVPIRDIEAPRFWLSIMMARRTHESSGAGKQLSVYSVKEYQGMRLFLNPENTSGFALSGDNIVSVFAHKFLSPGALPHLMDVATRNGGRRVDVYDTYLPRIYARCGFRIVAKIPWDDEYAPDGWDYGQMDEYNHGRPDVVFMVYDPSSTPEYVGSYDEAEKIQRMVLSKAVV